MCKLIRKEMETGTAICNIAQHMSVAITFIRHAQSTFNAYNDLSSNAPITDTGKIQCKSISGEYDLVVCSTLRRAREPLDNSNIKYKRIIFTELCREILDGNTSNLYNGESNIHETHEDVVYRINKFKEYLLQQPEAKNVNTKIAVVAI